MYVLYFFYPAQPIQDATALDGFTKPVVITSVRQICPQGTFGEQCEYQCHCPVGTECDAVTGQCPDGCAPGWSGAPYCQAGKLYKRWIINCCLHICLMLDCKHITTKLPTCVTA